MRIVVGFIIAAAVIGGFVAHKQRSEPAAAPPAVSAAAPVAAAPAPREPSAHNWPKRALDRAAEVKRQVATERKANELP